MRQWVISVPKRLAKSPHDAGPPIRSVTTPKCGSSAREVEVCQHLAEGIAPSPASEPGVEGRG